MKKHYFKQELLKLNEEKTSFEPWSLKKSRILSKPSFVGLTRFSCVMALRCGTPLYIEPPYTTGIRPVSHENLSSPFQDLIKKKSKLINKANKIVQ
jgi:hypothetical protein